MSELLCAVCIANAGHRVDPADIRSAITVVSGAAVCEDHLAGVLTPASMAVLERAGRKVRS